MDMQGRLKNYALVICLFVFLFVIIGSGLHLSPGAAFLAAATGIPLMIYVFHRKVDKASRQEEVLPDSTRNEVVYVSGKTDQFD
jgi:Flp pilus assembly protein TadB